MKNNNKLKVAVLFGGCSEEHDVSVKSAREIAANINTEKYEPLYVGITKDGAWALCETPDAGWENGNNSPAILSPDRKTHGLLVRQGGEWRAIRVDVIFPVLHGKTGEDGAIQGLLELSGIPYVGCGIASSAVCMDKALAYICAKNAGVATPEYLVLDAASGTETREIPEIADSHNFTYPVFVKPARSGSSFGVKKVEKADELADAIKEARKYDSKVLIEAAVIGAEVGCAVLGNGAKLLTGEVDQILLTSGFFHIHQEAAPEKGSENSNVIVPAALPAPVRARIQETAKTLYRAFGCKGLARVDLFLRDNGEIVLNEINTMPGFTSYSRYPRMMKAAGIGMKELIERLIDF